jgi:hypothetical protein
MIPYESHSIEQDGDVTPNYSGVNAPVFSEELPSSTPVLPINPYLYEGEVPAGYELEEADLPEGQLRLSVGDDIKVEPVTPLLATAPDAAPTGVIGGSGFRVIKAERDNDDTPSAGNREMYIPFTRSNDQQHSVNRHPTMRYRR